MNKYTKAALRDLSINGAAYYNLPQLENDPGSKFRSPDDPDSQIGGVDESLILAGLELEVMKFYEDLGIDYYPYSGRRK